MIPIEKESHELAAADPWYICNLKDLWDRMGVPQSSVAKWFCMIEL